MYQSIHKIEGHVMVDGKYTFSHETSEDVTETILKLHDNKSVHGDFILRLLTKNNTAFSHEICKFINLLFDNGYY